MASNLRIVRLTEARAESLATHLLFEIRRLKDARAHALEHGDAATVGLIDTRLKLLEEDRAALVDAQTLARFQHVSVAHAMAALEACRRIIDDGNLVQTLPEIIVKLAMQAHDQTLNQEPVE